MLAFYQKAFSLFLIKMNARFIKALKMVVFINFKTHSISQEVILKVYSSQI